jgi:phage I-like protein
MGVLKFKALVARLNAVPVGDTPPREFRIFKKGENETTHGTFLFDDAAALSVMAAYAEHGIDIAIDREHLSLDQKAPNYDPDARGWCNLELRDGELWAVNVRWTPDGEARLRNKTQRYISPVFTFSKDNHRILALYNIAMCAIPATHEAPPLIAASKRSGNQLGILSVKVEKMDALKAICAALGLKEDATIEEALSAIKAMQEPDEKEGEADPAKKKADEAASDDPKDEEKLTAALNKLPPKIRGTVMAAISAKDSLSKRLEDLEKKQTQSEVETLIASHTDKIPLQLEGWARAQPVAVLKSFIAAAVSVPRTPATPPKGGSGSGGDDVTLTDEDKELAKLSNIPEAEFLKSKKARVTAPRARA